MDTNKPSMKLVEAQKLNENHFPFAAMWGQLIFLGSHVLGGFGEGRAWLIIIIMAVSGLQGAGQEAIRFWEAAAALFFGFRLRLEGLGDACL
ncbi:hypothetical protein PVL29_016504 [Vitis rotundifolia]|uniref:Uncharacterized protein n=1 Tax=Vitis rotundifolia TaxID=103349 RepID=A0AA38Z8L3_VITRO|nr:hypothetical protein PVL29_016504 [Vitis rotundifolia]